MGVKSVDEEVVIHNLEKVIQEFQKKYRSGKTTANALTSNKGLLSEALNNYNLVDAITAFLEILRSGEHTLKAIREFLTVIQGCDFRAELSGLLNELINSNSENLKRIIIEKLQNTKQNLTNGTTRIMSVVTTFFETYILLCTWEDLQNADMLTKNQKQKIKEIQQEIERMEGDIKILSKAMSKHAKEEDENKKKKYDEFIRNRVVSLRFLCVKVKQDIGDLKLITGKTINDLRSKIIISTTVGVCSAAAGIGIAAGIYTAAILGSLIIVPCFLGVLAVGCVIIGANLNEKKKVFMKLLEMLEQFGKKVDEFYAIIKEEGDLEAKKLEAELDL